jgi:AhpD family alkylhydroperoxidase
MRCASPTIGPMLGRVVARVAGAALGTEPVRVFAELDHHPRLFRVWLPFSTVLLYGGSLPARDTELVILRTAWLTGCRYEWVQHASLARRRGLDEAAVAASAVGAPDTAFSPHQRLLLEAVEDLHHDRRLRATTQEALHGVLDDRQLIELCILVGAYEMLAMLLTSRGVPPEPAAVRALPPRLRILADQLA